MIAKAYSLFYNIDNVYVLGNFRDQAIKEKTYDNSGNVLNIIYYSRVSENKGIFDLINAVKELNKGNLYQVQLDIFGENQLVGDNANKFFELQDNNIAYRGEFYGDDAVSLLAKYDLFCLPTKYHGEGTSGSLIEAMIAGTPVLALIFKRTRTSPFFIKAHNIYPIIIFLKAIKL